MWLGEQTENALNVVLRFCFFIREEVLKKKQQHKKFSSTRYVFFEDNWKIESVSSLERDVQKIINFFFSFSRKKSSWQLTVAKDFNINNVCV